MTTTTEMDQTPDDAPGPADPPEEIVVTSVEPAGAGPTGRRPSLRLRFAVAFLVSMLTALVLGTGAIYAYEQHHSGRVLPGVRVGTVDLSGLERDPAIARLADAYAGYGQGRVVIRASVAELTIPFADFARRADVEAMADAALAVGRSGSPVDRAVSEVRTALRGITLEPRITLDPAALASRVERELGALELDPVDGTIAYVDGEIVTTPARWGRTYDTAAVSAAILDQAAQLDAPTEITVDATMSSIRPAIDDTDTQIARTTAERMTDDVTLALGKESWTVTGADVRSWLSFATTPDGRVQPTVDPAKVEEGLAAIAKKVQTAPKNATFLVGKGGSVVGVTPGRNGRALDAKVTAERISAALAARAAGQLGAPIEPALVVTKPALSTEEAEKAAPLMTRISTWKTYFPISEKNGYGANIWIPALIIDGYVLAPGEKFDFWKAVGPVTREKGYRDGGAIINGKTEPQGALAGGICSCSTTLFNAALRAGLDMGARRNHYYYIDRYPLGLDATVFISASGSTQTMSFTNDTKYPILIRGYKIKSGNRGYVQFDLYSVPTGRTVSFTKPIVKNVRPATTKTQTTTTLAAGARKQVEYPVDGKDVWVTRTVRDASGKVIHNETYYSHYSRVDGLILIGKGASSGGSTTPKASPSPAPSTAPAASPTPSG
jgi:vancomycin resistance protein YoaR